MAFTFAFLAALMPPRTDHDVATAVVLSTTTTPPIGHFRGAVSGPETQVQCVAFCRVLNDVAPRALSGDRTRHPCFRGSNGGDQMDPLQALTNFFDPVTSHLVV